MASVLRDTLRAIYLTGGAAAGAYRPGESDIDVLVVAEAARRPALDDLVARCSHAALPCPAEKLELVVYEVAVLADPGLRPAWSLNFNTGHATHHVGFDPGTEPAHWFVIDLAYARRHALPLVGPPAANLIAEPPEDAVRSAFAELVAWYEQHEPGPAAELAAKRARHWAETGEFATKAAVAGLR